MITNKHNFEWMKEKWYVLVFLSFFFLSFLTIFLSFPPFSISSLSFFLLFNPNQKTNLSLHFTYSKSSFSLYHVFLIRYYFLSSFISLSCLIHFIQSVVFANVSLCIHLKYRSAMMISFSFPYYLYLLCVFSISQSGHFVVFSLSLKTCCCCHSHRESRTIMHDMWTKTQMIPKTLFNISFYENKKLNFDVCVISWCSETSINSHECKSFEIDAVTIKKSMTEYNHSFINVLAAHLF